ncbi:valine--tRNA ligase [Culicoides brevitarsis]|uniref:valine--tRNA ligase n=1 Tax=Culicoides brevitarsis TaxID=469753 RepID=UPI00307B7E1D
MYFLKNHSTNYIFFKETYKIRKCTTKTRIETGYQPRNVEKRQELNALNTLESPEKKIFSMILPPPNVTGHIHLGHCLTAIVQDVIARYKRKSGFKVEWIPGMDHAGIATQIVVEKYLKKQKNITRHDLGRQKFIKEVLNWKDQRSTCTKRDLLKLGTTLDWKKEYFTMDDSHSHAVREAFIRLFDKGLIYRTKSLVNWSCTLESTISDIEIDHLNIDGPTEISVPGYDKKVKFGQIYDIVYKTTNGDEIIVSTTRPETILGDVAVAVNPRDPRYSSFLQNKNCKLVNPFRMDLIPIIADESIDMDFGSGAVKITPAHDKNDFGIGQRHDLPLISVINEKGNISLEFKSFANLPRFNARDMIINALMDKGLLRDIKPYKMCLPICSRSKDIIEFQLRSQWFVRCKRMSEKALEAVKSRKIKIYPETFIREWEHWLSDIHDWCISRQLWWGHQIPVYLIEGTWVAAHSKDDALHKLKKDVVLDLIKQDEDVLDTWFSSALLPFSLHGWPKKTSNEFYPLDIMETGHDIIFFWVARMVMLGIELTDTIPFKEILLHGIVCDAFGRKMSKSLGNIITPKQIINGSSLKELQQETKALLNMGILSNQEYKKSIEGQEKMFPEGIPECGTDTLRFTLCSHNIKTHFINFDIKEVYANKLFLNKIWNATRYVIKMNETFLKVDRSRICIDDLLHERLLPMDKWILSRLSETSSKVNDAFTSYNLHCATMALKNFFRNDLCDTYLETTKINQYDMSKKQVAKVNCLVLNICLAHGLDLMEIFTPFLSLDLKKHLPLYQVKCLNFFKDPSLEREVFQIMEVCSSIRQINSQHNITKQQKPTLFIHPNNASAEKLLKLYQNEIASLSFCVNIHFVQDNTFVKCDIKSTAGSICSFGVSLDQRTELNEKSKEINLKKAQKLEKELQRVMKIVSNTGFANAVSDDVKNKMNIKIMKLKMELENIKKIR